MPRYDPIDAGIPLQASQSNLLAFTWRGSGITADFALPTDQGKLLRVSFDKPCIVRLLDEMPLSTEDDDTPVTGLVSEHFAYRVEGAAFFRHQSAPWKHAFGPVAHYRLITGWACLDVLSAAAPSALRQKLQVASTQSHGS